MDWDGVGPLPTIETDLERAGYGLTEPALLGGLHDPRARVRSLAVEEIAKQGWKDAVPSIEDALAVENDLGTRLWMNQALADLGEEKGRDRIVETCNASDSMDLKMTAAGIAMRLGSAGCDDMVIDTLHAVIDHKSGLPPVREAEFISVIYSRLDGRGAEFKARSAEIRAYLEASLTDTREGVRMAAVNTLATFGDAGSLAKLRRALAAENGQWRDTMRKRMIEAIAQLEQNEREAGR